MASNRYLTSDGKEVGRHAVNNHHVFWPNRIYDHGEQQLFRNMSGLVVPLLVEQHNHLHADVTPPPKPSRTLRMDIAEATCGIYETNVYDEFYRIAHFIGQVANSSHSPALADEAYKIHESLIHQSAYIEIGKVNRL